MTDWTLLPTLVLRSAGFSWHTVERLRWRRTLPLLDRYLERERRLDVVRRRWPGGRPTRGQAARLRNARPLSTEQGIEPGYVTEWNAAVAELADAWQDVLAASEDDAGELDDALRQLVADPRFLDAVVCSAPAVYRDLSRGVLGTSRIRRQVGSYAQRLAAKCETMSFFGPINYARVDPAQRAAAVFGWRGGTELAHRTAFLASWAARRLHDEVLDSPELAGGLVPRRKTFARPVAGGADDVLATLVTAVDGRSTLAELAARCDLDLPVAIDALRTGMNRGLLTHDADLDATAIDPVRRLAARLAADDDGPPGEAGPRGRTRAVVALLDRYPEAEPARKVNVQRCLTDLLGAPPEPNGRSKFYNDRVVVHEAAAGTVSLTIGGELAADLGRTVPEVLELLGHAALRTRRRVNQRLARAIGVGRFPLAGVLRRYADLAVEPDTWLADRIAEAVAAEPGPPEIDLAPRLPAPPVPELPLLCSADVMIVRDDLAGYRGGDLLVLGDIHDAPLLTPWALQFHPDAGSVLAERDAAIVAALGERRAVSVVSRRTTGLPPPRFPGPLLELGPVAGPAERVRLDRLFVHSDGTRAELRSAEHPGELLFHNGELDSAVHTALGLPRIRRPALPGARHLPRLRFGSVVLSRRRWRVDAAALTPAARGGPDVDRVLAARRLAAELGLPDRVFAKAPHERKPVYVDLASPPLLDGLYRLAAGADQVDLTEVLPGGGESWLRDEDRRFAAELRCVYLRPAGEDVR